MLHGVVEPFFRRALHQNRKSENRLEQGGGGRAAEEGILDRLVPQGGGGRAADEGIADIQSHPEGVVMKSAGHMMKIKMQVVGICGDYMENIAPLEGMPTSSHGVTGGRTI